MLGLGSLAFIQRELGIRKKWDSINKQYPFTIIHRKEVRRQFPWMKHTTTLVLSYSHKQIPWNTTCHWFGN